MDAFVTKLSTNNSAENDENADEEHVDLMQNDDVNNNANNNDTPEAGKIDPPNPWPYLEKYFKFIGTKGTNNLELQCNQCKPQIKKLSTNYKSMINLKKHISRIYPSTNLQFGEFVKNAAKDKRKRKHNEEEAPNEESGKRQRQLTIKETTCNRKVSQATYENKVCHFGRGLIDASIKLIVLCLKIFSIRTCCKLYHFINK